jgi:hypothetical protein
MDKVTSALTVLAAIGSFGESVYLCLRNDSPATAATALGFAFLFLLLLHMSKFKHVKGFGFEGETWDQEQVKAAELRKSLSEITLSLSQQAALLAAKVGYWDSALSLNELSGVLKQTRRSLDAIGISDDKKEEILTPIYRRVEQYYWYDASEVVRKVFGEQRQIVQAKLNSEKMGEREPLQGIVDSISSVIERINYFTLEKFRESYLLTFLIDAFSQSSALLDEPTAVVRRLNQIDDDLKFFIQNRDVRVR